MEMNQGILQDLEILYLCQGNKPMLDPFIGVQAGKPSYGLGSFGYDLRLGPNFLVHKRHKTAVLDPISPDESLFEKVMREDYFVLQPNSQVLAETVEWFNMPDDILAIISGKSSYARLGLLVNVTPAEAAWSGRLTLELANLSPLPIRLYVGRGIAQVIFFRGERPMRTYTEKEAGGAYQDQQGVTLPL